MSYDATDDYLSTGSGKPRLHGRHRTPNRLRVLPAAIREKPHHGPLPDRLPGPDSYHTIAEPESEWNQALRRILPKIIRAIREREREAQRERDATLAARGHDISPAWVNLTPDFNLGTADSYASSNDATIQEFSRAAAAYHARLDHAIAQRRVRAEQHRIASEALGECCGVPAKVEHVDAPGNWYVGRHNPHREKWQAWGHCYQCGASKRAKTDFKRGTADIIHIDYTTGPPYPTTHLHQLGNTQGGGRDH